MKFIIYLIYLTYVYSINKVRKYKSFNNKIGMQPRFTQVTKIPNFHNVDEDDAPPYISAKYMTTNYVKPIYAQFESFLENRDKVIIILLMVRRLLIRK